MERFFEISPFLISKPGEPAAFCCYGKDLMFFNKFEKFSSISNCNISSYYFIIGWEDFF